MYVYVYVYVQVYNNSTKMDFEEAHNNLRAIRLLYRLLHNNTLSLENANSQHVSSFFIFYFLVLCYNGAILLLGYVKQ